MNVIATLAAGGMIGLGCLCALGTAHAQSYPNKVIRLVVPFAEGGAPGHVSRRPVRGHGARPPGFIKVAATQSSPYPVRPIRLVVPFAPGGGADLMGRTVGQKLSASLGQPVVIDNRAGAAGRIGAELAAKAPPDGYALFLGTSSTLVFAPSIYHGLAYDPVKDFSPVALLALAPYVLVVHPSVPVRAVKELIALAKSNPGKLNYASSGAGGPAHLAAELFNSMAETKMTHISYKGSAPGTIALISGETDLMFSNILPAVPPVKAGKLKALAVTSARRSPVLPELPTVGASGLPGFDVYTLYGILAPADTPKDVVNRLNNEIVKALGQADVKERLTHDGTEPVVGTPEQFADLIKTEIAKWAKVIKQAGIAATD